MENEKKVQKIDINDTYPPSERYKTHCPAEALNSTFHSAIVLIILSVLIHHKPESVLND